jgi:hypothetical protein
VGYFRILLLCVAAAVLYGIVQDQVTAHVCVEYFTIGHPPVFPTDDPTALAFGFGVLATWWVGALLGVPLAFVARWRSRPKLGARDLLRPLGVLMACVGLVALLAGVLGYAVARAGLVWLLEPLTTRVPPGKHAAFLADAWAHTAAYATGILGGILLWTWAWNRRKQLSSGRGGGYPVQLHVASPGLGQQNNFHGGTDG